MLHAQHVASNTLQATTDRATVGHIGVQKESLSFSFLNSFVCLFRLVEKKSVILLQRVHLFPFRTQKLSSAMAKILAWRRVGKIAHCWHRSHKFRNTALPVSAEGSEQATAPSPSLRPCALSYEISEDREKSPRITDTSWCFYRRGSTCSHSEHRS